MPPTDLMIPPRRNSFNGSESAPKSPTKSHWWFLTSKLLKSTNNYGSSNSIHTVATQKLRESKWFHQDEERLACAVIESGFIVEIVSNGENAPDSKSHYGVVSVEAKKSKSNDKASLLSIFDLFTRAVGFLRVKCCFSPEKRIYSACESESQN